jgi:UDP-glucose 4-epimerase
MHKGVVMVTGGAGYIGSHTAVALAMVDYRVVIFDNLSVGSASAVERVRSLASQGVEFIKGDIRDRKTVEQAFSEWKPTAVLHFAGLKAVGESVEKPLSYYDNNVVGSHVLLGVMARTGVRKLVFSSSATVYGDPQAVPITESHPVGSTTNPYGRSKYMVESMLADLCVADPSWRVAILRYFNPAGAHSSGRLGEAPAGVPNNLVPYVAQVASGARSELSVFGNDYPTHDGTGVRDYVHVMDLADGHICALEALDSRTGQHIWNLGTGRGQSVLEIVRAFEQASGRSIPFAFKPRRAGDIAACYADVSKAAAELGWRATRGVDEMMRDAWRWQQHIVGNP